MIKFNPISHSITELNEQATDNTHQHTTGVNLTPEGIKVIRGSVIRCPVDRYI